MNSLADILSHTAEELFPYDAEKTKALRAAIYAIKDQMDGMLRILDSDSLPLAGVTAPPPTEQTLSSGERVIEGVFNGEKLSASDNKEYAVPPNYASKSKLVHGDRMKLTITKSGSFIFKQIGPVERRRIVGELAADPSGTGWIVVAEGKPHKVLTASVTFYKGKGGDEAILLLPRDAESAWGAVDNIISK